MKNLMESIKQLEEGKGIEHELNEAYSWKKSSQINPGMIIFTGKNKIKTSWKRLITLFVILKETLSMELGARSN